MSEQLSLVQVSNCTLTTMGAQFDKALEFKEWLEAGKKLCAVNACVNWWVGDWINFGETKWGEKYAAALEVTDLEPSSLRNIASTCARVDVSLRNDKLTWSHYIEIAKLKGQKVQQHWIDEAISHAWPVSELRKAIREAGAEIVEQPSAPSFSVIGWATQGLRWFKQRMNEKPIEQWPTAQRDALKAGLKPIVEVYEKL